MPRAAHPQIVPTGFAGLDRAPRVTASQRLIVADRSREDAGLGGVGLLWLKCVGMDHSTPLRGIAVLAAAAAEAPATEQMVSEGR